MNGFFFRLRRKVFKRLARNAFFPGWRLRLLRGCGVSIGRDVYIADDFIIVEELAGPERVEIGDRVSIAPRVTIVTSSHPNNAKIRSEGTERRGSVVIEPDAWIGVGAVVLPGVRIGRGAIVGAMAVVTRDVESLTVVSGVPAEVIRTLSPPADWS